jgi:hypothetical protein
MKIVCHISTLYVDLSAGFRMPALLKFAIPEFHKTGWLCHKEKA